MDQQVKMTDNPFKEGDLVVLCGTASEDITHGTVYRILEADRWMTICFRDNVGDMRRRPAAQYMLAHMPSGMKAAAEEYEEIMKAQEILGG